MPAEVNTQIENTFLALPPLEREAIISHGAAIRVSSLKQRLFLAQSKARSFEEKYQTTLEALNDSGLPDQTGYEMHEDYLIWMHWAEVVVQCQKDLAALEKITSRGVFSGEAGHAGG
jgi:hypothetical protein